MIKIWLDDERDPTQEHIKTQFGSTGDEIWCKTIQEAQELLSTGNVESISFDHDLGVEDQFDGAKLADWIEEQAYHATIAKIKWRVHSMNVVGRMEIVKIMTNADKWWDRN